MAHFSPSQCGGCLQSHGKKEELQVCQNKTTAKLQQIICNCLGDIIIWDVHLGALLLHISSVIFHGRFVSVCPSCLSIGNVLMRWGHIVMADVTVGRKPAPYERRAGGSVLKLPSEHLTSHPAVWSALNRKVLLTSLWVETYF